MFDCRRLNWWTVLLFFFAPNLPWPTGSLHLLARISQWTTTFLLVLLGATSARNPNSLGASKRLQDRSMTTVVKFPTDTDKPLQRRKKMLSPPVLHSSFPCLSVRGGSSWWGEAITTGQLRLYRKHARILCLTPQITQTWTVKCSNCTFKLPIRPGIWNLEGCVLKIVF